MKIKMILLIGLAAATWSCNDWLTVTPADEISSNSLFTKGQGFRNSLNGIYIQLSARELYGRELSWGMLSVMSQTYDTAQNFLMSYKDFAAYKYNEMAKGSIDYLWTKAYNAMANCNSLIKNVQNADKGVFQHGEMERKLILGEALGIRAFVHFDLLRLFAPAPLADDGKIYIPYVTRYPAVATTHHTVDSVLNFVIRDLEEARRLVADYDTMPAVIEQLRTVANRMNGANPPEKYGAFFTSRGTRMNYYAICGLLARVYLYAGNTEEAEKAARIVLDSKYFSFTTGLNGDEAKRNRKLYDDILLALYNRKLLDEYYDFTNGYTSLTLRSVDTVFKDDGDDYRKQYLIKKESGVNRSMKYMRSSDDQANSTYGPLIPVLRMSEMYYIIGECVYDRDRQEAMQLLKDLRLARGAKRALPMPVNKDAYLELLLKDGQKEFIGEGQLYFMYKRLNKVPSGNAAHWSGDRFVFPIPESEIIE